MHDGRSCTRVAAERQASTIKGFWAERGHIIKTSIEPLGKIDGKTDDGGFVVRTNMINGLPVTWAFAKGA